MPNMGQGMMPEGLQPGEPGAIPNLAHLAENMAQGQCNVS